MRPRVGVSVWPYHPRIWELRHNLGAYDAANIALAEALGRHPESGKYSADMSKHAFFGTDKKIRKVQTEYRAKL